MIFYPKTVNFGQKRKIQENYILPKLKFISQP